MKKSLLILFLLLAVAQTSYAQLSNFILTVTKTDESCTGNASLTFNVSNTTAGSTIIYRIYKLPDTINSIAVLSTNTYGGLTAGTYRVIATQTLGANSGTQQQDIVILDARTFVTYTISNTVQSCSLGTMTVDVLTGTPVTYEILSGPTTVPPQASNVFPNLPEGTYNIRVNDSCGEGVVQTYTMSYPSTPNLTVTPPSSENQLPSCNSIGINYNVIADPTTVIRYPLTVQITINPPGGGAPIIQNQVVATGPGNMVPISSVIPFYVGQSYSVSIRVTDACGNVCNSNNNIINFPYRVEIFSGFADCHRGILLLVHHFMPPYTVNFLSAPAGFNPLTFNPQHPGPFTTDSVEYLSTSSSELPDGGYMVQVTDACGQTQTVYVEVGPAEPEYAVIVPPGCDNNYFLQIPRTSANPLITSAVFTASTVDLGHPLPYDVSGMIENGILYMPITPGTYTVQGMDVCGHPYNYLIIIKPREFTIETTTHNAIGCAPDAVGSVELSEVGAQMVSIIITAAPPAYNHPLPYDISFMLGPGGSYSVLVTGLNPGNYTLSITDVCGNHFIENITIGRDVLLQPVVFYDKKGCGDNYDSIALVSPNGGLVTVIITAAPASFPFTLPYDVSFNIATNGIFYMNSFPQGSYTFYTKDLCNEEMTATYNVVGYHRGGDVQVISNCGSFDLNMNFTDNTSGQAPDYWLQRYNTVTGQWEHPLTGVVYPANSIPNGNNSYSLTNLAINYNIAATGTFRILTRFAYYGNGVVSSSICVHTIKTFDYDGALKIVNAYAIPCVNGGSQVFILADGSAPLHYSITTKDGLPFLVDNGTANSFAGLQPGTYNFRVQDICGNIVNRLFDINTLQEPEISSSNICIGLNGQLSVQPFSFLNYQWWKDGNPGLILSTTNSLPFTPFTAANAGVYHVRIYSTTLNSCVDRVLDFSISPNALPNAGQDGTRAICGTTGSINLFTLLNGPYDSGGTWTEITSSGMMAGNDWLPTGLADGTYIFTYTVNGFCGTTDEATVTIHLSSSVPTPVVTANAPYCPGEDLELSVEAIPDAVYQWTGPDGFSSALQNPTIPAATAANAGTYTIEATVGQCEAQSTITVNMRATAGYTFKEYCSGGAYTVEVIPVNGSFNPITATYAWTGPNNFTSTSNPIIITNQPLGDYSVLISDDANCFDPQTLSVTSTFCDFPNVITPGNDGLNDSFDLSNYDVELFQVFSRWGRLVYELHDYTNQWYGQNMHGGFLPDSTYYYFVKLRSGEEKHGWIFVGRG